MWELPNGEIIFSDGIVSIAPTFDGKKGLLKLSDGRSITVAEKTVEDIKRTKTKQTKELTIECLEARMEECIQNIEGSIQKWEDFKSGLDLVSDINEKTSKCFKESTDLLRKELETIL